MPRRIRKRNRRIFDERYASVWDELWLKPGAPRAVIDAAYKALSKQYHPDVSEADGRAQIRLNTAYTTLISLEEPNGTNEGPEPTG